MDVSGLPWAAIMVALGLVMGSAVTALSHRLPRSRSWVRGRSACPACGATLGVRDLVPVLSFLLARGRCRHCNAKVAWRYPLTELWCAAWALLLFRQIGLVPALPWLLIWGFLLVALFWIDLDFQLLPDALTLPGALAGIAAALTVPEGARHAVFAIVAGSGLLWLLAWAYLRVRRIEGMGFGDVKLAAMFGAAYGFAATSALQAGALALVTLFLAALAGSVWGAILIARGRGGRLTAIPFGCLLAPAAMVMLLWGNDWLEAYLGIFR